MIQTMLSLESYTCMAQTMGHPGVMHGPGYDKRVITNRPDYGRPAVINGPE